MTIEEKLNSIRQTKEAIKTSIRNKGVELEDTAPFNTYPSKIDEITSQTIIETENIEITPTKETQTINRSENKYIESVKVNAIPDEYIIPSGELEITENGNYDVTDKASVNVAISDGNGGVDLTEYFIKPSTFSGNNSNIGNWIKSINKISKFDTNDVKDMAYFFSSFNGVEIDLSEFDTSLVTTMRYMFYRNYNITNLDLSSFNVENVLTMECMFMSCNKLESLDLSNFITTNLTNVYQMFTNCTKLTHLDIRNFDFTKVTSYSNMLGSSASNGVPNDCLIIVKDETAKEWITSKFSRLTNVKTLAEYETQ